jgi:hypothetical protein
LRSCSAEALAEFFDCFFAEPDDGGDNEYPGDQGEQGDDGVVGEEGEEVWDGDHLPCPVWSRLASRRFLCGRQRLARRNAVRCAAKKGPLDEEGPKNRARVIGAGLV